MAHTRSRCSSAPALPPATLLRAANTMIEANKPVASANGHTIRLVGKDEYKEAAECLAEAFVDDEVARYFLDMPDTARWANKRKWELHASILEYVTYALVMGERDE
ncbi:hypothetical protein P152DRAFT_478423 [Eremomyces bilateralis CBS 781.70]|uniref:Uncharacterized protein n=1 Tax=Eremomyces bilateralis CBS 781.70 TaxID=1392243 RepID=A0A6G1GH86_9PEZI|nr:uncharacterized protein P152DRAFT_478423 [Eremomyces bilateralis CBS 781.70]KAF1817438.1 hypothetical protein P152DRAFT_478423 [Eremomyces bilateralis CBS 781.70]